MTAATVIAAIIAGGLGAGLRYLVDVLVMQGRAGRFPFGILIVNVTGSLALGLLTGLGVGVLGEWLTIAGVGLLGGYTTFSTVSVETVLLAERRRVRAALANVLGTAVVAISAAAVGFAVGSALAGGGG